MAVLALCGAAVAVLALSAGAGRAGDPVAVPSGQRVELYEVIWNDPGESGMAVRFRFIAPQIARDGGTIAPEVALADMDHLCRAHALPEVDRIADPRPDEIIISLSDMPVPFGTTMPEATQFIEVYLIEDGTCVYEGF